MSYVTAHVASMLPMGKPLCQEHQLLSSSLLTGVSLIFTAWEGIDSEKAGFVQSPQAGKVLNGLLNLMFPTLLLVTAT